MSGSIVVLFCPSRFDKFLLASFAAWVVYFVTLLPPFAAVTGL